MSAVYLTNFDYAEFKPSKRKTKCKNCDNLFGPKGTDLIRPKEPRIVVSGGWGPSTRHLTLCLECASTEVERLEALIYQLVSAINESPD